MKRYYNIFIVTTILLMGSSSLSAQCTDDVTNAWAGFGMTCASVIGNGVPCNGQFSGTLLMDECPLTCDNCPADCDANGATSHGCCLPDNNIHVNENGSVLYNSVSVCAYCEDPDYNNATIDESDGSWIAYPPTVAQTSCEATGSTWIVDGEMNSEECAAVPDIGVGLGGYWYDGSIGGFQFKLYGVTLNGSSAASGGDAGAAGLTLTTNPDLSKVLAFSLDGATFGPACGTMVEVDILDGTPTGLYEILISDPNANQCFFNYMLSEGNVFGCMDENACNYVPEAVAETDPSDGTTYPCEHPGDTNYEGCDCDGNVDDCNGICGGPAILDGVDGDGDCCASGIVDECGDCNGSGPLENFDCFGNCISNCDFDCFGLFYGTGEVDECNQCIDCSNRCVNAEGIRTGQDNEANCTAASASYVWMDYEANCSDSQYPDQTACEDAVETWTINCISHPAYNASCTDCHGDTWGSAFVDACETCVGGNTFDDFDFDNLSEEACGQIAGAVWYGVIGSGELAPCGDGILDDGETYPLSACPEDCIGNPIGPPPIPWSYDNCNVCDNIPGNNCEVDCNGDWGGNAEIDNCGLCVLGLTEQQPCVPDCAGMWGGNAAYETYYLDSDGDGDGDGVGAANTYCDASVPAGWVTNNDDSDDNCYTNVHDCAGVCDGDAEVDECGVCGGDGIDTDACDCAGNINDCAGVCGGTSALDTCGECNNYTDGIQPAFPYGTCDCAGTPDGDAEVDSTLPVGVCCDALDIDACGFCDGPGAIYDCGCFPLEEGYCDCDGNMEIDCFGICGGSAVKDCAGVCDGPLLDTGVFECTGGSYNNQGDCEAEGNTWAQFGNDECGECDGSGASYGDTNCCEDDVDCAGVCFGDAIDDPDCGCNDSPDEITGCCNNGYGPDNEDPDCAGECGGPAVLDCAGTCDAGWFCSDRQYTNKETCEAAGETWTISDANYCSDSQYTTQAACEAAGFCSIAEYPIEGTCTYYEGIWTSGIETWTTYWIGDQGVGVCSDTQYTDQTACEDAVETWTINGVDCNGVCGGPAVLDLAEVCCLSGTLDECGECEGNSWFTDDNGDSCNPESSIDCLTADNLCDCQGNVYDCNGECGGPAIEDDSDVCCASGNVDDCGTCNGPGYNNYGCCFNITIDCNGICGGGATVDSYGNECIVDPDGVYCLESFKDECGYCHGPGVLGDDCDCFGNIVNCAGVCPTIYTGDPGVWEENLDWSTITYADDDLDGICDDLDDCVSDFSQHLIFNAAGSIMMDEYGNPSPGDGGFDLCGVCKGDGFTCDFEAEGGFEEINLSWNRPNMGGLEDYLNPDSSAVTDGINFDDTYMGYSISLSTSMADTLDEICSEPPDWMPDDTTYWEYGFPSTIDPAVSFSIDNVEFVSDPEDGSIDGTFDIFMSNIPACSYCTDPAYNFGNNTPVENWKVWRSLCEDIGATWIINTDPDMTKEKCADIPSSAESGGWWFNGNVAGLQFYITGVTITNMDGSDGSAYIFDFVSANSTYSLGCDNNGTYDEDCNFILAASLGGYYIPPSPPGENELFIKVEFEDFNGTGICFGGIGLSSNSGWAPPEISDTGANPVLADFSTCYCPDYNPADDCGVCGGLGSDQFCGCGLSGNCELQEGACDCTGRMPANKYKSTEMGTDPSLDGEYICWDSAPELSDGSGGNGTKVCDVSECSPDPNAFSYNLYRQNPIGNYSLLASDLINNEYTDGNLGYYEPYCYLVSYSFDVNTNGEFEEDEEVFLVDIDLLVNGNIIVNDDTFQRICGTTDFLVPGCTYASSCEYEENANYYVDDSCWWPTYGCGCNDEEGAISDECGVCDNNPSNNGSMDNCGICDNNSSNDCEKDCFGSWGGNKQEDDCGVCGGGNVNKDCNGDCFGSAALDGCDICSGGASEHVADSDQDCAGACGGFALVDECGTCDADQKNDCIEDCNGEWGGSLLGYGILECYSIEDYSIVTGMDSTACINANNDSLLYIWGQIGNDECGVCDGLGPIQGYDCEGNLAIINGLIPEEYNINNIYPNPFNPVANIEFGLPENAYVHIVVYDIQGRQVATLINSFQFAGYYSIKWNATDQSSGVYFIRMMTDTFQQTKQVMLMK